MKILLLPWFVSLVPFAVMGQSVQDKKFVNEVIESFVQDCNNGDFNNASYYTTNDWVHINPGGGITRGREEVLKEVRAIHQTMLKGVRITIDTMTTRFVSADVAITNVIHKSGTYISPEDGVRHENERQIKSYVVVRQKGKWLLTLDQNTIVHNP